MPTNQNAYNSRVTDEALEKRFRDTFTSQGGAELVSDLYASGVIVPVVDFTAAAEGSVLRQDLQRAWDFSTAESGQIGAGTTTAISNTGFWLVGVRAGIDFAGTNPGVGELQIFDGTSGKVIWSINDRISNTAEEFLINDEIVVFLRAGDSLRVICTANAGIQINYRQIADVNGNLTNPLGFTSS